MFLAVVGLVLRLVLHFADDAPLAGYLLAVSFIFGITPFHEGRYLFSITPFLVYFAYQGTACLFELLPTFDDRSSLRSRVATVSCAIVASLFVFLFVCGNGSGLWRRTALLRPRHRRRTQCETGRQKLSAFHAHGITSKAVS